MTAACLGNSLACETLAKEKPFHSKSQNPWEGRTRDREGLQILRVDKSWKSVLG
jgi:hypothetical protein